MTVNGVMATIFAFVVGGVILGAWVMDTSLRTALRLPRNVGVVVLARDCRCTCTEGVE